MLKKVGVALGALLVVALVAMPVAADAGADFQTGTARSGATVKELKLPTPAWYTAQLHAKVRTNSAAGRATPIPAEGLEWLEERELSSTLGWDNRPGTFMIFPAGCTMNFLFSGTDIDSIPGTLATAAKAKPKPTSSSRPKGGGKSRVYLGTAGHCADNGDEVTTVSRFGLLTIGKVVKSVDGGLGRDQAFVEIYSQFANDLYMDDGMMELAGPTGSKQPAFGDPIVHVGNGIATGLITTPPRAGVVTCVTDGGDTYTWRGEGSPGDSGSPTRHATGPATGNLTHIVLLARLPECDPLGTGNPFTQAGAIAGTTITKILSLAPAPLSTDSLVPDPL